MTLYPLFPITNQFQDKNGMNLVAGIIRIFYAGRTEVQPFTYKDSEGNTKNPQDIILDNNGRAVVYVNPAFAYNMFVYDCNENLLWSQYNIFPEGVAEIKVDGMQWVEHDETLKGSGTIDDPLSVNMSPGPSQEYTGGDNIEITDDGVINVIDRKAFKVQSPITKNVSDDEVVIGLDDSAYAKKSDLNNYETKLAATNSHNTLKSGIDNNSQEISRAFELIVDKATTDYVDTKTDLLGERIGDVEDRFDNYYDKDQVDGFLKNWSGFVVVPHGQQLPAASDAQLGKIYLWQESTSKSDNYSEWISDGSAWSKIGEMSVDLSNYYTKQEVEQNFATLGDITTVNAEIQELDEKKLEKVEVDGVTITGDGTEKNPLKASIDTSDVFALEAAANDIIQIKDDASGKVTAIGTTNSFKTSFSTLTNSVSSLTSTKQDKLTAGSGISINNNVISASGAITPVSQTFTDAGGLSIPAGKIYVGTVTVTFTLSSNKSGNCLWGLHDNYAGDFGPKIYINGSEGQKFTYSIGFYYDNSARSTNSTINTSRSGILATEAEMLFTGVAYG